MENDYINLKQQVDAMQEVLEALMSSTTLPKEFVAAMRIRLIQASGKTTASVTQLLPSNPAGLNVAKVPDGFSKLNNDNKNYPFYYD